MDEALVPHALRLRIRRSNFRLLSDISSKESTLQLVNSRRQPLFIITLLGSRWTTRSTLLIWSLSEKCCISVQDYLVNHLLNHHLKKRFLPFFWFLGHSGAIRRLTDVNINKLHQPWRSFAAIINKCLTEKSSGYDSLRLSQAQILWGLYHKRNVDFAYQVEHKDTKKSNEMYYPRFTKTKSSSDTTVTPPPTTAACLRLSTSAKGKQPATTSKVKSLSSLSEVAMTEVQQLKLATKRILQQTHISQASSSGADEGTGDDDDDDEGNDGEEGNDDDAQDDDDQEDEGNVEDDQEEGSDDDQASDKEEFIHPSLSTHEDEETRDEKSFDPIPKTPENTDAEGNGQLGLPVVISSRHSRVFVTSMLNPTPDAGIESIFEMTSQMDVHTPTSVAPLPVSAPTLTPSTIATITTTQQAPTPPTTAPSTLLQDLPNFGLLFGFDHRLKTLEANFFKLFFLLPSESSKRTRVASLTLTSIALPPSTIPTSSQVQQAPTPATTAPSTFLQDLLNFGTLFGFDHRLKTLEDNWYVYTDNDGDEFVHPKLSIHEEEETKDEESFDPIIQTPENSDDEDVNINLEGRDVQMTNVHTIQEFEDTHVTLTLVNPDGQQQSSENVWDCQGVQLRDGYNGLRGCDLRLFCSCRGWDWSCRVFAGILGRDV
nr:hypothetical protein [Tanacetum cinerariifolium]